MKPRTRLLLSLMLLALSCTLIFLHGVRVRQMKEIGLPAALALPHIERRLDILKEQAEIMQLQQSVSVGSKKEQLHAYVLPTAPKIDRFLATLDALFDSLRRASTLTAVSAVRVGGTVPVSSVDQHFTLMPVSFEVDVNEEGLRSLFLFSDISGLLTVGDALSHEEQALLLSLTEQENPAAISALENFLSESLIAYAHDPKQSQEQLLKSFSSESFAQALRTITRKSRLQEVTRVFNGDFLRAIDAQVLWPLRYLEVAKADIKDNGNNQFHVALTLLAYGRQAKR